MIPARCLAAARLAPNNIVAAAAATSTVGKRYVSESRYSGQKAGLQPQAAAEAPEGARPSATQMPNLLDIGMIINATLGFLITAAVIFFIIIKPYNALMARVKKAEPAPAPAGPSDEVKLLTEIRDALKK